MPVATFRHMAVGPQQLGWPRYSRNLQSPKPPSPMLILALIVYSATSTSKSHMHTRTYTHTHTHTHIHTRPHLCVYRWAFERKVYTHACNTIQYACECNVFEYNYTYKQYESLSCHVGVSRWQGLPRGVLPLGGPAHVTPLQPEAVCPPPPPLHGHVRQSGGDVVQHEVLWHCSALCGLLSTVGHPGQQWPVWRYPSLHLLS